MTAIQNIPGLPGITVVTLAIDGRDLSARSDQSILDVARENNIQIPTLCFLEGLSAYGGCRLCLVEIAGSAKLQPACVSRVTEGMKVTTDSPRLLKYRRMVVQMLFSERNHVCAVCVSNGHCELQSLAKNLGLTQIDLPYRFPTLQMDASHDLFRLDHDRCVLCSRCVRVCDEIEGAHTWDIMGRGIDSRVIVDLNEPWGESQTCTTCGKCVEVCPTGTLTRKGWGVAEIEKDAGFLPLLRMLRGRTL